MIPEKSLEEHSLVTLRWYRPPIAFWFLIAPVPGQCILVTFSGSLRLEDRFFPENIQDSRVNLIV